MTEESTPKPTIPFLPDANELFTEPLDPSVEMSAQDRWELIKKSQRPWGEFFDISKFNLPPLGQWNQRVKENIVSYFYNYFIIAVIHVFLYSILHFKTLLAFAFVGGLYILKDRIAENIESDKEEYLTYALGIIALFAFFWANGFSLIFSVLIFNTLFISVHSSIRDNTADDETPEI